MGTEGPPSLSTFWLEQEIYKRLGENREAFLRRPAREVDDYVLYIQLIAREEQAQQRRQSNGR